MEISFSDCCFMLGSNWNAFDEWGEKGKPKMKIASFSVGAEHHIGVVVEDKIMSLTAFDPEKYRPCLKTFIAGGQELHEEAEGLANGIGNERFMHKISNVKFEAPLAQPEKIICVGLNYIDHCEELGIEPPASPVIFAKFANAIIGDGDAVELPVNSKEVDFEAELVVVIGKEAKKVSAETAEQYIFGYTIMNDISARDVQFADGQWTRGKTADTFAPIGPVIATRSEVADPHALSISLELNGQIMQDSNTKNLIFSVPQIVSFLSQSMTLKPGDIIATGTPPGVGAGRNPKVWLKDGDTMAITIDKIGTLSNHVTM